MLKKILSLAIAVTMMCGLVAIPAKAATPAKGVATATELTDAIAAGEEKIVLTADIDFGAFDSSYAIKIANGQSLELDLNGHTLSATTAYTGSNTHLILNEGELVIDDSTNGDGTIVFEYTGPTSNWGKSANTITNNPTGSLTVNGGTIKNVTDVANHIYYAIDTLTNGTTGTPSTIINGGKVINETYTAMRAFANSKTNVCSISVYGGEIIGTTGIYLQSPSANPNLGGLYVAGGKITATGSKEQAIYVYGPSAASIDEFNIEIIGGSFVGLVHIYPEDTTEIMNVSDDFTVEKEVYTYDSGTNSYYYTMECKHLKFTPQGDGVDPTCTEEGLMDSSICDVCGIQSIQCIIEPLGHDFKDGVCTECGTSLIVDTEIENENTSTDSSVGSVTSEVTDIVVSVVTDIEAALDYVDEGVISEETAINLAIVASIINGNTDVIEEAIEEGYITEDEVAAIKEVIEAGESVIKATIAVEEVKEDVVDDAVVEAIKSTVAADIKSDAVVACFLDVSVVLSAAGKELGTMNVLETPITVTIKVPEELKADNRTFYVVRNHDGEVEVLETTLNADGTVSFETDRFSTYALAYEDAEKTPETDKKPNAPTTGENNMLVVLTVVVAAVAVVAIVGNRRKHV